MTKMCLILEGWPSTKLYSEHKVAPEHLAVLVFVCSLLKDGVKSALSWCLILTNSGQK